MKKCLVITICLLLCFVCTACGVTSEVEAKLKIDRWAYQDSALGTNFIQVYEFYDDGKYMDTLLLESGGSADNHGTYEVTEDAIILVNEDGREITWTYVYEDGELKLFNASGQQLYNIE